MAVISIPILLITAAGSRVTADQMDSLRFGLLTLANVDVAAANSTVIDIFGVPLDETHAAYIITLCDFVYTSEWRVRL